MEVLISVFVLSIGLIGVAALLPVGRLAIVETVKADRAGTVGRAGQHTVKTCRLLDSRYWTDSSGNPAPNADVGGGSFAVDPFVTGLYPNSSVPAAFGGTAVQRYPLQYYDTNKPPQPHPWTLSMVDQLFRCQDDLSFSSSAAGVRPSGLVNASSGTLQYAGDYSWFFTVTPMAAENALRSSESGYPACFKSPYHYLVSVVVCYKRI